MKIIKPGVVSKKIVGSTHNFHCKYCGCIFTAHKNECRAEQQYNEFYFVCECPCCKRVVYENRLRGNDKEDEYNES